MRRAIVTAALLTGVAACGRKATVADCQLIVDQNVAVQMRAMHVVDPAAIAKKQAELQTELKGELKECVGRRVSDTMMSCVKGAQTSDEIAACLR
jgi:hypothetical protein